MDQNIKTYQEAIKTATEINKEIESINKDYSQQIRVIEHLYNEKISTLEEEKRIQTNLLEDSKSQQIRILEEKEAPHRLIISKTRRLLDHMNKFINGHFLAHPPEIYYYSNKGEKGNYLPIQRRIDISPVATLRDDKYNKIFLYITHNKNKVNKFTLHVEGHTALSLCTSVRKDLKDAPTEKDILNYMNKNIEKIKSKIPNDLDTLITEFESAIELFKNVDYQLLYLKYRMDYYKLDYSQGTEMPEYKDVCALYKHLEKNPKNLVLLIGQLKSTEGIEILEKLLKQ
jgi:hypothetical protein